MDRHIGAQLYSTREPMKTLEGFEDGIRKLKEIGYSVVQVSGIPLAAKDMKKILDDYGMTAALSHRGYNDFKNNLEEIMEYNATLGLDSCCVGMAPVELLCSKEGVSQFIEDVNAISDKLSANGFLFGYHNHCCEFAKYDGKTIMDRLCEETDPKKTKLVVDTFWLQAGGVDPANMRTVRSSFISRITLFRPMTSLAAISRKSARATWIGRTSSPHAMRPVRVSPWLSRMTATAAIRLNR